MSELDYHVITTHEVEHVLTVVDGVLVIVPPADRPIPLQQEEQSENTR